MGGAAGDGTLAALLNVHHDIEARMRGYQTPDDVLKTGWQVLEFAGRENEAFSSLLPLIDPAARAELAAEHDQIEGDLQLLASLLEQSPQSSDVAALACSIARRMAQHVERDGRLLARAARMPADIGRG